MASQPSRPASEADFTFQVADRSTEDLKVTGFEGEEGIGRLFRLRVFLCSDDRDIDLDQLVGQPCTLRIRGGAGDRYVNGIVRLFERSGEGSSLSYYAAEIVPAHWLLTQRHRCRIFQESNCADMTAPGIIRQVLEDSGLDPESYRFATQGTYTAHEYVVQYRESEMDFIRRIMEDEGLFFFFEHAEDRHVMVIGDSPVAHTQTPGESEYAFRTRTGMVTDEDQEFIFELRDGRAIQPGAVTLRDHDFRKPADKLLAQQTADRFTSLEFADYPGGYQERDVGQRLAKVRLEEFQCNRAVQTMRAAVRTLLPGYKFTLKEHPVEALNREYLVTEIVHRARQGQSAQDEAGGTVGLEYEARVRTIPAEVPYRMPRRTPRPRIHGSQTAVVVGPQGEELYTDKYGRVKVQYFWDRDGRYDENSSRWTRVSQGSAGGQYGIMFLPRVGQEVVVEYLEGDPNRPIVTGRVYNNDQMPPYSLPDKKTVSCIKTNSSPGGGGTNEIRFEDKKGEEQIMIFAQKDLHVRCEDARVEKVGSQHHLEVGGKQFVRVGDAVHRKIATDLLEEVGGNVRREVKGDEKVTISGNLTQEISGSCGLKSGGALVIESPQGITLKCGGNFVVLNPAGVSINGTLLNLNSGGAPGVHVPVVIAEPLKQPDQADKGDPGHDVTYQQTPATHEVIETERIAVEHEEQEREQEQSWIEIELVDDEGRPVPFERYELVLPNGRKRYGRLDANGLARVNGIKPGSCEINFPRLDKEGWRR